MATFRDLDLVNSGATKRDLYCARCGLLYFGKQFGLKYTCVHINTADPDITPEHAERIAARYAFGKLHNPNHDETDYRDCAVELGRATTAT